MKNSVPLEQQLFITKLLWKDNSPAKIEEAIIEFSYEFQVELHEAEETVNQVLSMRP